MTTLYLDCETLPAGTLAHLAAGLGLADPPQDWTCPEYPPAPTWDYQGAPRGWKDPAKLLQHQSDAWQRHQIAVAEHAAGRDAWETAAREQAWEVRKRDSLDPLRCEIACLGYAVDGMDVEVVEGPKVLATLDHVFAEYEPAEIVAHNAGFDAEALWVAAVRSGNDHLAGWLARWDYRVVAQHKLWRGPMWVDTMDLIPFRRVGDYRFGVGQQKAADLLGCAREHPIRGDQVFDAVMSGRLAEVMGHCRSDVAELRDIHRRLWAAARRRA